MPSTLLVVDDEPMICDFCRYLFPESEVTVVSAATVTAGIALFAQHHPDVLLLDVQLPDESGLRAFQRFHDLDPKVPIILMTGAGSANTAIEAMRLGAYEYVDKPLDVTMLHQLLATAFEMRRLMRVAPVLPAPGLPDETADALVSRCAEMREVCKSIGRVAPQDVTVLILGDSGTGKELVARSIYHYSRRSSRPFLAINCAAIPEALLESELFGHEKGAFTGADRRRIGKFEQCGDGTLFLDEIGDMPPLTQAKVLRVLQDQQFERVGGTDIIRTNVRLIAATNHDLNQLMAAGRFRRDLYYRLNVYTIQLPPLRERGDDVELLTGYFIKRINQELGKQVEHVTPEVMAALQAYHWPGNVRELQSVLKQALLRATSTILTLDLLPPDIRETTADSSRPMPDASDLTQFIQDRLHAGSHDLYAEVLGRVEQQLFRAVLEFTVGNRSEAARILGITRPTLRSRLASLKIDPKVENDRSPGEFE